MMEKTNKIIIYTAKVYLEKGGAPIGHIFISDQLKTTGNVYQFENVLLLNDLKRRPNTTTQTGAAILDSKPDLISLRLPMLHTYLKIHPMDRNEFLKTSFYYYKDIKTNEGETL